MRTTVYTGVIFIACAAYAESRETRMNNDYEMIIADAMLEDQRGLWARLLRRPAVYLPRAATIARLKAERSTTIYSKTRWNAVENEGYKRWNQVCQLWRLAELSSSEQVEVTGEEAWIFKLYNPDLSSMYKAVEVLVALDEGKLHEGTS